ncbi:spermatogenesis-associated protein 4 isoform X1 [Cardiocondyla obscurior]|uniref:spermatogenesis-associated protein 4 isoform X1 n=1 Tax=Cardiocondyla obscurior TaxID=286306 RepID=UPI0039658479
MIGDMTQINRELVEWIGRISFSRPVRNVTRDFSDAVLAAEILKLYYPRHVELHNYIPVNSISTKKENWRMLNRKVLVKLDMKLNEDEITQLASGSNNAIEKLLARLQVKVLKNSLTTHKLKFKENIEGEKIINSSPIANDYSQSSLESSNNLNNETCERENKLSKFMHLKQGILFSCIFCVLARVWHIFVYCIPHRFRRHRTENVNDKSVQRTIYELNQELCKKEEIINSLEHKIVHLKNSIKFTDLPVSSLTAQILQNDVKIKQSTKSRSINSVRTKSRLHSFHETKVA